MSITVPITIFQSERPQLNLNCISSKSVKTKTKSFS